MTANVYVTEDQQSLAIGRRGQNVRLASKLTGWELNICPITPEDLERLREKGLEQRADDMFGDRLAKVTDDANDASTSHNPLDQLFDSTAADGETKTEVDEYEDGTVVMGLEDLPGVSEEIADRLIEAEIDSTEALLEAGVEGLSAIEGLDEISARLIIEKIQEIMDSVDSEEE